jgi:ParB-like chromosome segregation protein Spo0J
MEIVDKKTRDLIPYINNPRKNEKAVDYIAESIKAFGFKVPIVVDSKGVIVAGHTRVKAATKLGLKTVPCIVADDLSEEQIRAFRLADNKTAEFAEWDMELLPSQLADLAFDMSKFGFDSIPPDMFDDDFSLNADERSPFQTISFTLYDDAHTLTRAANEA